MPNKVFPALIKKGESASDPIQTLDAVLVSAKADQPVKVKILGALDDEDKNAGVFLPLSVQPGPPEPDVDLSDGIVLFSVAFMQGCAWMMLLADKPVAEDTVVKLFFRTFPND